MKRSGRNSSGASYASGSCRIALANTLGRVGSDAWTMEDVPSVRHNETSSRYEVSVDDVVLNRAVRETEREDNMPS